MAERCTLPVTPLISYGKHRLVHYKVEAKEIGCVHEDDITHLIENWGEMVLLQGDDDQNKSNHGEGNLEEDEEEPSQGFEEGAKVMMRVSKTRMKIFTVAVATRLDGIRWPYQLKMTDVIR